MKHYGSRSIDEMGRMVLPAALWKKLEWQTGAALALQIVNDTVVLRLMNEDIRTQCFSSEINELGMITLPDELRQEMRWEIRNKIDINYADDNEAIILRLA